MTSGKSKGTGLKLNIKTKKVEKAKKNLRLDVSSLKKRVRDAKEEKQKKKRKKQGTRSKLDVSPSSATAKPSHLAKQME